MNYNLLFIILLVSLLIFIILQETFCWYFKINKRLDEQKKTNELLTKILNSLNENKQ